VAYLADLRSNASLNPKNGFSPYLCVMGMGSFSMGFIGLLRSIEELLYEIMAWLVFYPRTLWRVICHPLEMLAYSDHEQGDAAADQYTDTLSPPLFLMLTILLAHGVELAFGQKPTAPNGVLGTLFANSEEALLLYRSFIFSVYPLMFAIAAVKRGKQDLDRNTLRQPFFSQCYIGALFALMMSVSLTIITSDNHTVRIGALSAFCLTILIYLTLQAVWLRSQLPIGYAHAALVSLGTFLKATLAVAVISSALVV
jgi:hypothetical protein